MQIQAKNDRSTKEIISRKLKSMYLGNAIWYNYSYLHNY